MVGTVIGSGTVQPVVVKSKNNDELCDAQRHIASGGVFLLDFLLLKGVGARLAVVLHTLQAA
jgi:hypothetical protein